MRNIALAAATAAILAGTAGMAGAATPLSVSHPPAQINTYCSNYGNCAHNGHPQNGHHHDR